MINDNKNNLIKSIDNLLIVNIFVLIAGSIFFIISVILSLNGINYLYDEFQKLWFPLFIPSLSLFFTAILLQAIISQFNK